MQCEALYREGRCEKEATQFYMPPVDDFEVTPVLFCDACVRLAVSEEPKREKVRESG